MINDCFHGGASFDAVGTYFDRLESKNKVIRADVTDAWYDPAPNVMEALGKDLAWLLRNSPPTNSEGLVKAISKARGIPKENLLVGGGSSDLMFAFFPNYRFDRVTILDPMYGEYSHIFENVLEKKVTRVRQTHEDGFKINIDDIIREAEEDDIIVMVNPNSPTGQYLTRERMQDLLDKLPEETTLFIDETYIDFIGREQSIEGFITNHKNLVVLKSMSKVYALSGARVGYLAAHSEVIGQVKGYIPPWSVGLIGQVAGVEALKNEDYYRERIAETHRLRSDFSEKLGEIPGVVVYPGGANFVLLGIGDTGKKAQDVCDELARKNIYVRDASSMSSQFDQNFIRTSVRDRKSNYKIYSALREVLTNG